VQAVFGVINYPDLADQIHDQGQGTDMPSAIVDELNFFVR
jgi:hypothetical protein